MNRKIPFLLVSLVFLSASIAHAQRELTEIPIPDPELEKSTFQVDDGWMVSLFAADPTMAKPIHMNWDNQNRLWIAASETYPQIKPGEPSNDKILIVVDENGDGISDRTITFADKLLIPTGVLPANDGPNAAAYVANSDQLIYLRDTDGDLIADERRIVLSGFGTEDTHHLLHSLRWGHDGWIYMNQSIYIHSHIETPWGVQRLNGGGIWRYHPETKRLEVVARGFVNPWGVHFDRYGQMFATDGAYGEGINYVFPGSVFVTAVGAKRILAGLNPGSPKHCSLEILSGSHWPDSIRGSMVTNDFRAHRVCRFKVTDDASAYESVQQTELIKTPHVAFRPIDAKQGLDGALYIADWYNPIIQHGEVDFRDPRRDRTHGRIWRLTHRDQKVITATTITANESLESNLARLNDDADLVRLFAGQAIRLQAKKDAGVAKKLADHITAVSKTDRGLEQLELLWLVEGLGQFNESLRSSAFASNDGRIRAAAVHSLSNEIRWNRAENDGVTPKDRLNKVLTLARDLVNDPHPRVRLETVRLLAELPAVDSADLACQVLKHPMDRFLDFALWQTMRDLGDSWVPAFKAEKFQFSNQIEAISFALRAVEDPSTMDAVLKLIENGNAEFESKAEGLVNLVAELGHPQHQTRLVEILLDAKDQAKQAMSVSAKARILQSLVETTKRKKQVPGLSASVVASLIARAKEAAAPVTDSNKPAHELGLAAIRALGQWKVVDAREWLEKQVADSSLDLATRRSLLVAVAAYADDKSRAKVQSLASDPNAGVATTAIEQLVELDLPTASQLLLARLDQESITGNDEIAIVPQILAKKEGPATLIGALSNRSLPSEKAKAFRAAVRKVNGSTDLIAAIDAAGKLRDNKWVWSESLRDRWLELARTSGSAERGEWIYRRSELQCAQCHRIGGVGGLVGPDLTSIGAQAPADYLFEALTNPAAKVKEGFNAKVVRTEDDEIVAGIPIRESDTEVVLRLADGKERTIPKDTIQEIKESRSLMPDGLLDALSEDEAVDLLRFMLELGKIDGNMLVKQDGTIRGWESLAWTQAAFTLFNRTSLDSISGDQSQFNWLPLPALVSGDVPMRGLATYQPHANIQPVTFARAVLPITRAGELTLELPVNAKSTLSLWANGRPIPIESNLVTIAVPEGSTQLSIAVNRSSVGDGNIRVRIVTDRTTAKVGP